MIFSMPLVLPFFQLVILKKKGLLGGLQSEPVGFMKCLNPNVQWVSMQDGSSHIGSTNQEMRLDTSQWKITSFFLVSCPESKFFGLGLIGIIYLPLRLSRESLWDKSSSMFKLCDLIFFPLNLFLKVCTFSSMHNKIHCNFTNQRTNSVSITSLPLLCTWSKGDSII